MISTLNELPSMSERRYVGIARDIARRITEGEFVSGERLPPERELATTLSVSRTTVREAVLALELMRYVEIRVGAGVFVLGEHLRKQDVSEQPVPDETSPSELLTARRLIEAEAARLAAQNAGLDELDLMQRCHTTMSQALDDVTRFDRADAEFHFLIAKASGNSLLEHYIVHLWQLRDGKLWQSWYSQTRSLENRKRSLADHQTILRAIQRRRPRAAATAMQSHIDVMEERFFDL